MLRARLLAGSVAVVTVLACGGGADPSVPIEPLPMGTVLSLDVRDGKKTATRLTGTSAEPWSWTLSLNFPSGGHSSGGDGLYPQDDGTTIFCGMAHRPAITESCWVIDDAGTATPIGAPVFEAPEQSGMRRLPSFGSDGSWWTVQGKVQFSPSMEESADEVPFEGTTRFVRWSAAAEQFLRVTGDKQCTLQITDAAGAIQQTQPVRCWAEPHWNRDGTAVAWVSDDGIEVWTLGASVERVLPRVKAPDAADEQQRLKGWSPDGSHLLLKSSRHRSRSYNPCAGIYSTNYWTYVLDVRDGSLKRIPDVGAAPVWVE